MGRWMLRLRSLSMRRVCVRLGISDGMPGFLEDTGTGFSIAVRGKRYLV